MYLDFFGSIGNSFHNLKKNVSKLKKIGFTSKRWLYWMDKIITLKYNPLDVISYCQS